MLPYNKTDSINIVSTHFLVYFRAGVIGRRRVPPVFPVAVGLRVHRTRTTYLPGAGSLARAIAVRNRIYPQAAEPAHQAPTSELRGLAEPRPEGDTREIPDRAIR